MDVSYQQNQTLLYFFQSLCNFDVHSINPHFLKDHLKHIKSKPSLHVNLPPPLFKPKDTSKPACPFSAQPEPLTSLDPPKIQIQPIPFRPNYRKKNTDPEPEEPKLKPANSSSFPASTFQPASSLISSLKPSPQNCQNPTLSKPFSCPLKATAQEAKEEAKVPSIDEKLSSIIESEIISRNPNLKWSDIAGLEFAKKTVLEVIVWPLKRPDLFKGLRSPPKGLMLFGPPGTGKTMIGKAIASEVNATFFSISASSITSKWVGEGEKLVKILFALAVKNQPSVIFIDEIDSLLSKRTDSEQDASRRIKTEFLVHMDGVATNPDDRILLIGATNRPDELDSAMQRRLAKRMYIPLPNAEGRSQILKNLMKDVKNELSEEEVTEIVRRSKGYSGSDMKNLCTEACMFPMRGMGDICQIGIEDIPAVTLEDFYKALEVIRPTVDEEDVKKMTDWNKKFGSFKFDYDEFDT